MTSDLSERLRQCAVSVGGGNELARKTGIPRRTLENYLNGTTEPVPSRLIAIAEAAGADPLWLLSGAGEFRPARGHAGDGAPAPDHRLERMRLISATLRRAVGEDNPVVNRQLWTDLQGLAYVYSVSHEAIPPIVELIVRAYQEGAAEAAGGHPDRRHG